VCSLPSKKIRKLLRFSSSFIKRTVLPAPPLWCCTHQGSGKLSHATCCALRFFCSQDASGDSRSRTSPTLRPLYS
jgi:hypothetical protein